MGEILLKSNRSVKENLELNRAVSKSCAELIGTLALVFFGCGAIIVHSEFPNNLDVSAIPIVFGLVIATMIYATGHISGAHFNPAVTIAFAATKKFPWKEVPIYIVAQVLGALLGALILSFLFPDAEHLGGTIPKVGIYIAFAWEFLLTFFLMFVIMAVATDARAVGTMAGIAIGGLVALDAFVGGPLTGASMNPARSIGPAVIEGNFNGLWIYLIAPVLGAIVAAMIYEKIKCLPASSDHDAKGCC